MILLRILLIGVLNVAPAAVRAQATEAEQARWAAEAKQAMAEGRFEAAAERYERLLESLPGHPGLLLNLGLAQHSAGRSEAAVASLEAALEREPQLEAAWLVLGMARLKLGDAEAAAPLLERYVQEHPENPVALLELGDAYLTLNKLVRAQEIFRRLTATQPQQAAGWLGLYRSASDPTERQRARARLEELPASAELHEIRGGELLERGRPKEAAVKFRRALELTPEDGRRRLLLGRALRRSREYDELLPLAAEMVERAPQSATARWLLGDALIAVGRVEEAIPQLEQAVEAGLEARASLGEAYSKAGRAAEAIPHLEAAREIDADGRIHLQLARAYLAAKRANEAALAMAEHRRRAAASAARE